LPVLNTKPKQVKTSMGVQHKNRRSAMLLGQEGNTLMWLIAINAIMFVLVNFVKISYFLGGFDVAAYYRNVLGWVLVQPEAGKLLTRPWSVFTFMFTHDGVWHMISNMLWLWAFGYVLQDLTGNKLMAPIYLYGGLVGAAFFVITVNAFPVLRSSIDSIAPLQGGGAAIMAVAVATTTLAPGYRIFPMLHGGIPLWVLTLVFAAIDYALIASEGAGIGVAHLAGGLIGFLFMKNYQSGHDWSLWMHHLYDWFMNLFSPKAAVQASQRQARKEFFYEQGRREPFKKAVNLNQQRIDEILDKISQKGMAHLTDEEKEYLQQASKEEGL